MNALIKHKTITPPLLIAVSFACFALMPQAEAVTPAPDGGYTGWNTAEGQDALFSRTTGDFNTAIGGHALYGNTTGSSNTAVGAFSLAANSSGAQNVAVGQGALRYNTTGIQNAANGFQALYRNTIGFQNTASGYQALYSNTTGEDNTANGSFALYANTGGFNNTANGFQTLNNNTDGSENTATGVDALVSNTTGSSNTATGESALFRNTGNNNTADGAGALFSNTTGNNNIALGAGAGQILTTGDNNIDIGNFGIADESNTIRLGVEGTQAATFIAGIYNVNEGGTILPLYVNSNGRLGTQAPSSSRRFKKDIADMDSASDALLALRPVTFRYKPELDQTGIPQFGLVAEEVAKVNPDLVVRDEKGEIYTVRYEAVNAMLLNEFLKEHRKVEEQEKRIDALTAQLKEQAAQIQNVSARLEASKPAPQVVNNP
jgi:Chaperone of endosialidase